MMKKIFSFFLCMQMCAAAFAQNKFTFLHFSDAHGSTDARKYVKDLMTTDSGIAFALDGGDMLYSSMDGFYNQGIYATLGNHDVIDASNGDEALATQNFLKGYIDEDDVVWGGDGYYYKDFICGGRTIRLICLNSFESKAVTGKTGSTYQSVVMTGTQHEWLADVLKETPSNGYIIIAMHAPVGDSKGFVDKPSSFLETSKLENVIEVKNKMLEFLVTESLLNGLYKNYISDFFTPEDGEYAPSLIPQIVDAYLKRGELKGEFSTGSPTEENKTMTLNLDFSACKPAKFLCYLTGHVHVDLTNNLKSYPNQLLNSIATTNDSRVRQIDNSLATYQVNSEIAYSNAGMKNIAIDQITVDFDNDALVIERIGRNKDKNNVVIRNKEIFDYAANLKDTETYAGNSSQFYTAINYSRNFEKDCWQALYLPFSLEYDDWADKADIAEFSGIVDFTDEDNTDRIALRFVKITEGRTTPNTPYLIKPRNTGAMILRGENTTLMAAPRKDGSVSFKSDVNGATYTLCGTYKPKSDMGDNYALLNGKFVQAPVGSDLTLSPYRVYLTVQQSDNVPAPQLSVVFAENEVLEIKSVGTSTGKVNNPNACFNLAGQRLAHPIKGINIINGKKIIK